MKKKFFSIFLILSIFLLTSFSRNNIKTVQGYVHVYGNDPFAYLGIITDDEKEYAIIAGEEEILKLWKTQGNRVELKGIITKPKKDYIEPEMLKDGKIEISEWKCLN